MRLSFISQLLAPTLALSPMAGAAPGARLADGPMPEMTIEWWQWAMMQGQSGPVADQTGALCAMGQHGDVWFLAGGFGSSKIRRSCEIPVGKKLFFPLVNMVYYPRQDRRGLSCEEAQQAAAINNETAIDLFAELDGAPYDPVKFNRLRTRNCFDVFARVPPQAGSYKGYPSASDGFWVMLQPLAPGEHVLKFGGRYNHASSAHGRMVQDIEYRLTVR